MSIPNESHGNIAPARAALLSEIIVRLHGYYNSVEHMGEVVKSLLQRSPAPTCPRHLDVLLSITPL